MERGDGARREERAEVKGGNSGEEEEGTCRAMESFDRRRIGRSIMLCPTLFTIFPSVPFSPQNHTNLPIPLPQKDRKSNTSPRNTHRNLQKPQFRSEMQTRVPVILLIRVLDSRWVIPHDAFDEGQIVEVDGAAKADALMGKDHQIREMVRGGRRKRGEVAKRRCKELR